MGARNQPGGAPSRGGPGVVLLEVVLSLTLFFFAAAVVVCSLRSSLGALGHLRLRARAADLAVTLLSEIQMGLVNPVNDGPKDYEDESLAEWSWQVVATPVENPNLDAPMIQVQEIIRHKPTGFAYTLAQVVSGGASAAGSQEVAP